MDMSCFFLIVVVIGIKTDSVARRLIDRSYRLASRLRQFIPKMYRPIMKLRAF